ncbi:SIS domain-containing protein [Devosia algicola]|uniref:SIS domain-containing protein n=1 Tax=Devosia algicola TaxID=3026418 RepID=A0ABY7YJ75_9HYPH|nr:SIS domain-containing protein [Devosia algicola]WDR01340.1 SIS domain-containing protein [Devosia algicola]
MSGDLTWRELISQPDAWAALISRLEGGKLSLPVNPADFDELILLGSGTSYYLALAAADWMRRRGMNARAIPSCEALLDPFESRRSAARQLAIGFSRSGYSSELILANKKLTAAGFTTMGISCSDGSDLLTQTDHPVLISEGFEDGLVMLRSFSSMLITAQWFFGDAADRATLAKLPEKGHDLLALEPQLSDLANARNFDRFVFLGSGPTYPLTLEGALKIQEMAIATSEAYHSLDYRHGPKACADENTAIVLFTLSERDHGLALARDLKSLGVTLLAIGADAVAYDKVADMTVPTGIADDAAGSVAALLTVQMFAFATALRRDQDPDAPANLSKVVMF